MGTSWENTYLWPGLKHTSSAPKVSADLCGDKLTHRMRHDLTTGNRFDGVAIRSFYVVLNFLLLACLYELLNPRYLLDADPVDMSPEKESIIWRGLKQYMGPQMVTRVESRELLMRTVSAVEDAAGGFLLLSLYHDVCAIIFIAIGLDESWEWPLLFGQITEAYTMRRW